MPKPDDKRDDKRDDKATAAEAAPPAPRGRSVRSQRMIRALRTLPSEDLRVIAEACVVEHGRRERAALEAERAGTAEPVKAVG